MIKETVQVERTRWQHDQNMFFKCGWLNLCFCSYTESTQMFSKIQLTFGLFFNGSKEWLSKWSCCHNSPVPQQAGGRIWVVSTRSALPCHLHSCIPTTHGAQADQENCLWWPLLKEQLQTCFRWTDVEIYLHLSLQIRFKTRRSQCI